MRRDRSEGGAVLVHAVIRPATVPGVLNRTAAMIVYDGPVATVGSGGAVRPGMSLLRAHRADHRLDERAGH